MRVRMVTRTVTTNAVNCLCLDLASGEPKKVQFTTGVDFPTGVDNQLKYLRKKYENSELAIAKILSTEITETIYGMTEDDFIKLAKPMTPDRKFED